MTAISFQDQIAKNKRSSLIFLVLVSIILFALVYVIVYIFASEYILVALPISTVVIILYAYFSYQYGDSVILSSTKARPAEGREYQYLKDSVEGLSVASGIPSPKIFVIDNNDMNAFATGRDPEHASIAVTTGLLSETNRLELEGVLAHEISHIRNRDILFTTLVAVLAGMAAILSHMILMSFWYGRPRRERENRRGGGFEVLILAIGFILAIFAPIIVRLIQFAISRRREYLADASAVEITRYPEGLASALEKIMKKNQGKIDVSEAISHLFFVDPKRSALDSLYETHPPIEERIKKLRAM